MKLFKKITALALSLILGITTLSFNAFAKDNSKFYFNFTSEQMEGAIQLYINKVVPKYSMEKGYGFVSKTTSMPERLVDIGKIQVTREGFSVTETNPETFNLTYGGEPCQLSKSTRHNLGGMCFRVDAPAGGYNIQVGVKGGEEAALVSISSMQATRVNSTEYWDAAKEISNLHMGKWDNNVYSLDYANGSNGFIDIEVEPLSMGKPAVLQFVKITPVENNTTDKNTIYLLGDSTLKSYLFEEAPMCGWGQVFDRLFDTDKINILNYSMGGRSVKQMYQEGRLNDIIMTGAEGDFVFIQSGHNDEKKGSDADPTARFGTGSTEAMYKTYLETNFISAIRARGMIPVLVTPMTRASKYNEKTMKFENSFTTEDREFVKVMKEVAEETDTPLIDLNTLSCEYLTSLGYDGAMAVVMSLEAGETCGKTNSGSYANGHPDNKIDTTHFKEALAKQYARLVAEEVKKISADYEYLQPIVSAMTDDVQAGNWSKVYPEVCNDVIKGENAYYRNQIEKMVQLGVMLKDSKGNFNPDNIITSADYAKALGKLYSINLPAYNDDALTREVMAEINLKAYKAKYSEKPAYMTDYNGTNISPDDPEYDPNLVGEEAQYYPLVGYGKITDKADISPSYGAVMNEAYELGLIRSEDAQRGKMINGYTLEPQTQVTRAKAAKSLYFMYVLGSDINNINDEIK